MGGASSAFHALFALSQRNAVAVDDDVGDDDDIIVQYNTSCCFVFVLGT